MNGCDANAMSVIGRHMDAVDQSSLAQTSRFARACFNVNLPTRAVAIRRGRCTGPLLALHHTLIPLLLVTPAVRQLEFCVIVDRLFPWPLGFSDEAGSSSSIVIGTHEPWLVGRGISTLLWYHSFACALTAIIAWGFSRPPHSPSSIWHHQWTRLCASPYGGIIHAVARVQRTRTCTNPGPPGISLMLGMFILLVHSLLALPDSHSEQIGMLSLLSSFALSSLRYSYGFSLALPFRALYLLWRACASQQRHEQRRLRRRAFARVRSMLDKPPLCFSLTSVLLLTSFAPDPRTSFIRIPFNFLVTFPGALIVVCALLFRVWRLVTAASWQQFWARVRPRLAMTVVWCLIVFQVLNLPVPPERHPCMLTVSRSASHHSLASARDARDFYCTTAPFSVALPVWHGSWIRPLLWNSQDSSQQSPDYDGDLELSGLRALDIQPWPDQWPSPRGAWPPPTHVLNGNSDPGLRTFVRERRWRPLTLPIHVPGCTIDLKTLHSGCHTFSLLLTPNDHGCAATNHSAAIVLLLPGGCSVMRKVRHAKCAGASGVVLVGASGENNSSHVGVRSLDTVVAIDDTPFLFDDDAKDYTTTSATTSLPVIQVRSIVGVQLYLRLLMQQQPSLLVRMHSGQAKGESSGGMLHQSCIGVVWPSILLLLLHAVWALTTDGRNTGRA